MGDESGGNPLVPQNKLNSTSTQDDRNNINMNTEEGGEAAGGGERMEDSEIGEQVDSTPKSDVTPNTNSNVFFFSQPRIRSDSLQGKRKRLCYGDVGSPTDYQDLQCKNTEVVSNLNTYLFGMVNRKVSTALIETIQAAVRKLQDSANTLIAENARLRGENEALKEVIPERTPKCDQPVQNKEQATTMQDLETLKGIIKDTIKNKIKNFVKPPTK